jgi:MFS family permease
LKAPLPPEGEEPPLFTPLFLVVCTFTFLVFLAAFQLFPTAPFRILALGGSHLLAGSFLGCLTYASALCGPLTGGLADRVGRRRVMLGTSVAVTLIAGGYTWTRTPAVLLGLAVLHGVFWSGLMAASAAYLTDLLPPSRRAEGIGYWGLASVLAVAVAPRVGFGLLVRGWGTVCGAVFLFNLAVVSIALFLPDFPSPPRSGEASGFFEWHVLVLSLTLFLYTFGYGGVTSFSALYAKSQGIEPPWLFLSGFAVVTLLTRPFSARLADQIGYGRVLVPSLAAIALALGILALWRTKTGFVASAVLFGAGFGSAYPVFAAHVMSQVGDGRRGAAFGSILFAFDTGIGTGSLATGYLAGRYGYPAAYGLAALLAALSGPYFLAADRRLGGGSEAPPTSP